LRVWKFHAIGPGDEIPTKLWLGKEIKPIFECQEEQSPALLERWTETNTVYDQLEQIQNTEQDDAAYDNPSICSEEENLDENMEDLSDDTSGTSKIDTVFDCPEPGCTASFLKHGHLVNHLDKGIHKYVRENINSMDFAIKAFKSNLQKCARQIPPFLKASSENIIKELPQKCNISLIELKQGWAIKPATVCRQMDQDQINYLLEKYNEGERSGKKWDPKKLAQHMRKEKIQGEARFQPEQYLKWQQILSYFSRVTAQRRETTVSSNPIDPTEENENCDADYMDDPNYVTADDEVHSILMENQAECFE